MTRTEYNRTVDHFSDGVYRFILKMCKSKEMAEDVVQVQAATPSEAKPELAQMTISGASGSAGTLTLSVKGTAGKKVKVTLYTMDETELGNRTITLEGGSGSVQFTGLSAGTYAADVQYYDEASGNYTGKGAAFVENLNVAAGELRHDAAVVAVLPVVAGLQDGQGGQRAEGDDPILPVGDGAALGLNCGPIIFIGVGVGFAPAVDDLSHLKGLQDRVQSADVVCVGVGGDEVV